MAVLRFGKMNLATLEAHLIPKQTILLTHPHSAMDGEPEIG